MTCVSWAARYTRDVMSTHPVRKAVEEREKDKTLFDQLHLMEPPACKKAAPPADTSPWDLNKGSHNSTTFHTSSADI